MPKTEATHQPRRTKAQAQAGVEPEGHVLSSEDFSDMGSAMPRRRKQKAKKPSRTEARVPLDIEHLRPTPYPATDTSENRAITVLQDLLNEARIKAEFQRRDKRPNIDGYVELVDKEGYPIGQLEVQIKTLSGKNLKARSFPCELGLLGYCRSGASRQVLLIGVDIAGRQAFWVHLSLEFIKGLRRRPSSATISVKFPAQNRLPAHEEYIEQWVEIVHEHRRRIHQLDPLPEKLSEEEKAIALLIQQGSLATESYRPEFVPIQAFLDELNRLLDNELKVVKATRYPNAWKIGVAFSLFTKNDLCYSWFPINKGHNEPLIRQVNSSVWVKLREHNIPNRHAVTVVAFSTNPILNNPIREARARTCELGKDIISAQALRLTHSLLAREFIFSLVDRHGIALGLSQRDVYQLDELASALYEYLPRWVEYALETLCPDHAIPDYLCGPGRSVNLDALRRFFSDVSKPSPEELRRLIMARQAPTNLPAIGSERYPLGMFRQHLAFLAEENVPAVHRPYSRPTNLEGTPGSSSLSSELWLPNDFARNFKLVMSHVLETYNQVVGLNFPLLQDRLSFFRGFDRMIIVLRRAQTDFGTIWDVLSYELSSQASSSQSIDIYCEGIDNLPEIVNKDSGDSITIDGVEYIIGTVSAKICTMDFFLQPLLKEVYSLLEKRFKEFAEEWLQESGDR